MNVSSTHFEYDATLAKWQRARDLIAGAGAVKAVGEKYPPRLDSRTDDEHTACGLSLSLGNPTARTADSHGGMIVRHVPFQRLSELKKVGEGVDARKFGQTDENKIPANLATSFNGWHPQMLHWVRWWISAKEIPDQLTERQVLFDLNTGSNAREMDVSELTMGVNAGRARAASQDSLLRRLPDGETPPTGRSNEGEERLFKRTPPPVPMKVQPTQITP